MEFKEATARLLPAGESGTALSRELDVRCNVLYRRRDTCRAEGVGGLPKPLPPNATSSCAIASNSSPLKTVAMVIVG